MGDWLDRGVESQVGLADMSEKDVDAALSGLVKQQTVGG